MNPDHMSALVGPGGCLTTALAEGDEVVLQVTGECMEPAVGHFAVARLKRAKVYVPGDVVAFCSPYQNRLLVHRLLGYVWRRGAWKLMTMSDRGVTPDPLVDASSVLGKVVALDNNAYRVSRRVRAQAVCRYAVWCVRSVQRWL